MYVCACMYLYFCDEICVCELLSSCVRALLAFTFWLGSRWDNLEIFQRKFRSLSPISTSLSDVNLVDDLPSARHTEAVGLAHGVFGLAPICNFDP